MIVAAASARSWNSRLILAFVKLSVAVALVALIGWLWFHHRTRPAPLTESPFVGVTHVRTIRDAPRPMIVHVVTIDLAAPGIGFFVTPGDPAADLPLAARTASDFLTEFHLQIAVNADFFAPWYSHNPLWFYPHRGDPVAVDGYACSSGTRYGRVKNPAERTLRFTKDDRPSFSLPLEEAWNAVSGEPLLDDGAVKIASFHDVTLVHPRTAVGLDRLETKLFLVVVDGRQPAYSEGCTLPELARILLDAGAWNALNLDGGGSTTLVMEGASGQAITLDSPIHTRIPGRERPVANHLGIRAQRR
ncbi:MAG: phosphodiester glycosidase family protein [Byssovorax sp.]